jgi:hypothetical protein
MQIERADQNAEKRGLAGKFAEYRSQARALGLGDRFAVVDGKVVSCAEGRTLATRTRFDSAAQCRQLEALERSARDLRPAPRTQAEFDAWLAAALPEGWNRA